MCSSQWPLSSSSSSHWAAQLQGGSQGSGGLAAYLHMLSAFTLSCTCLHEAVVCFIQCNFLWVCHEEFCTHVRSALFEGIFVIECICCMLLSGVTKLSAYRSPCTTFMWGFTHPSSRVLYSCTLISHEDHPSRSLVESQNDLMPMYIYTPSLSASHGRMLLETVCCTALLKEAALNWWTGSLRGTTWTCTTGLSWVNHSAHHLREK